MDGLRGLAALSVVCSHTSNAGVGLIYGVLLFSLGRMGVWLFFVLSAFLLTDQAIGAVERGRLRQWLPAYCLRRIFRIYPLMLFALAVYFYLGLADLRAVVDTVVLGTPMGSSGRSPLSFAST